MTGQVNASEMLSVKVSVASSKESAGAYISMAIDTSRIWINDSCTIGKNEEVKGSGAMTVAQARNAVGKEEVWVSGYIVGGDLTASAARFEHPFKTRSNLLVGPRSSTNDRAVCLSVQLPEGDVREALNLVDHPSLLGRKVYLRGHILRPYVCQSQQP